MAMTSYFRDPLVEEGERNIILQNRCGNRLTLLFFEDRAELELVYKPNAYRRKDYRARNFSNRDNFTTLFRRCTLPQVRVGEIAEFEYDPFVTGFHTLAASGARNRVTVLNVADENVFALAARAPLLLALRPHAQFSATDGLLLERFEDRGEEIVSFVAFAGYEANRYRVLESGEHVLQLFENEVVLLGAEESVGQARRAVAALAGLSLGELLERNEARLSPTLAKGRLGCADPLWQQVLDLNRRIVYSGIDEGGACFGALNRIYHLIWVRDGAMTTSLLARSGNPDYLRLFAPFLLENPSRVRRSDGSRVAEFSQLLGSRWSKSEDDGIYYAFLTLFTHFATTGDDALLRGPGFELALEALDRFLEKAWEPGLDLVGSDTRGESPLASNPYFGYDVVCGRIEEAHALEGAGDPEKARLARCYSLYQQVNTFNALTMATILLAQREESGGERAATYRDLARRLRDRLRAAWTDEEGLLYASLDRLTDGNEEWRRYGPGVDHWEYAWAVSLGPFFPVPERQLPSAWQVLHRWPALRDYGFCPWNTLSRQLREYGMCDRAYHAMLDPEFRDALTLSHRYPMLGALGEYAASVNDPAKLYNSWRALPFTAGSLIHSLTGLLLQSLPLGLAVRASRLVDRLEEFHHGPARLTVEASGAGEQVGSVRVNGRALEGTLQLPTQWLRSGRNRIAVERTETAPGPLLQSSNAELFDVRREGPTLVLEMRSEVSVQLVFTAFDQFRECQVVAEGQTLPSEIRPLGDRGHTLVEAATAGDFLLRLTV